MHCCTRLLHSDLEGMQIVHCICAVAYKLYIAVWLNKYFFTQQIEQSLATRTEGGKSTASSFQLPNNPEQWAVFEVPEQVHECV